MPTVAPAPGNAPQRLVHGSVIADIARVLKKGAIFSGRLPGQASVSKLDAFERFRLETSPWRVALILVVTPLPWLIINVLLECIPLNDPKSGFKGSGFYQLRILMTSLVSSLAPVLVKLNCVPGYPIRSRKAIILYILFQATLCVGTNAIIALAADIFPVPFSQFTVILPATIGGRLFFYRHVPDDPHFHALSDKVNQWLGMEMLPIVVYPVFTAVFTVLTPSQQLWVSLVLPVLKVAVCRALSIVAKSDADLIGVITCCVGHLYHVLFTAMILQNAKTLETLAVVGLFSTGQMLFNCRCILIDSIRINDARARVTGNKDQERAVNSNLDLALAFAQHERVARRLHWHTPSLLLSTYRGYCGDSFVAQNREMLRATTLYNNIVPFVNNSPSAAAIPTSTAVTEVSIATTTRILPYANSRKPTRQASSRNEDERLRRKEDVIHKVAAALHQTEMILLRSYVTICMTLFYVIYSQVVFRLTNRRYFATFVYLTSLEAVNQSALRLLLLCAMEMVFLSVYLLLISRRLGISGVYQIAFILWSQKVLVQAKFYVTVIILGFPLTHNGNDSILRFQSLRWKVVRHAKSEVHISESCESWASTRSLWSEALSVSPVPRNYMGRDHIKGNRRPNATRTSIYFGPMGLKKSTQ